MKTLKPKEEQKAQKDLSKRKNITANSDKGGALVIRDTGKFIPECNGQLLDQDN